MSNQLFENRELSHWEAPQLDELPPRFETLRQKRCCSARTGPVSRRTLRPGFFWRAALVAAIAILGEIAALYASSALHLGITASGVALASVVLAVIFPLARSAT